MQTATFLWHLRSASVQLLLYFDQFILVYSELMVLVGLVTTITHCIHIIIVDIYTTVDMLRHDSQPNPFRSRPPISNPVKGTVTTLPH